MNLDYLKEYFKRGGCPNLDKRFPPPDRKFVSTNAKEGRLVMESLKKLIEIPEGVKSLTLHINTNSVIEAEITYYPKFVGELDDD